MAALQKALKDIACRAGESPADATEYTRQGGPPFAQRRVAEHDLIDEITSAAKGIADARD